MQNDNQNPQAPSEATNIQVLGDDALAQVTGGCGGGGGGGGGKGGGKGKKKKKK